MKKHFVFFFFTVCFLSAAQTYKTDTIIDVGVYKSYFNYALKEPLYVTYTLHKGGGDCDRKGFTFKKCGIISATGSDYASSPYDKGHLANAEDFANNCENDEKTFCYYNCVPQTKKLNRGIWEKWETTIREESQSKSLFIIVGSIYSSNKTLGKHHIGVPDYCYKIVMDSSSKEVIHCLIFPNDDSNSCSGIPLEALKSKLGYDLMP